MDSTILNFVPYKFSVPSLFYFVGKGQQIYGKITNDCDFHGFLAFSSAIGLSRRRVSRLTSTFLRAVKQRQIEVELFISS